MNTCIKFSLSGGDIKKSVEEDERATKKVRQEAVVSFLNSTMERMLKNKHLKAIVPIPNATLKRFLEEDKELHKALEEAGFRLLMEGGNFFLEVK